MLQAAHFVGKRDDTRDAVLLCKQCGMAHLCRISRSDDSIQILHLPFLEHLLNSNIGFLHIIREDFKMLPTGLCFIDSQQCAFVEINKSVHLSVSFGGFYLERQQIRYSER